METNMKFEYLSELMEDIDLIKFKLSSEEYRKIAYKIGQLFKQMEREQGYVGDDESSFDFDTFSDNSYSSSITTDDDMDFYQYREHYEHIADLTSEFVEMEIWMDDFGYEIEFQTPEEYELVEILGCK